MTVKVAQLMALAFGLAPAALPYAALAQDSPSATADNPKPDNQTLERQLDELKATKKDLAHTMQDFDARITALESEIHGTKPAPSGNTAATRATVPTNTTTANTATAKPVVAASAAQSGGSPPGDPPDGPGVGAAPPPSSEGTLQFGSWGAYDKGNGFVLVRGKDGEVDVRLIAYARYLNQLGLDKTYTDSFGRTFEPQRRQDVQWNKVNLSFKGWLLDPDFTYRVWVWTQQPAQGEGAQVVVGGHVGYRFSDYLNVYAGIAPLPTTRSTNWTYPLWLKMDNRTIADEFFRGSYTQGFWADGKIVDGLDYRVMIGNNLSALGVSAAQLDNDFETVAAAVWWMPTTGEFGPALGFGDYENHEHLATMFGLHYTHSREDKQEQPSTSAFENSQIRLSDGTLLFSPNAFNTGGQVDVATYQMLDFNAGLKYQGFSLESEIYWRWVDDFETTGFIPVDSLFDDGFQIQASAMVVPKELQIYAAGSEILGQYGKPWDLSLGLNWYPFDRREMHINAQGIYLNHSPVGGTSYPYVVGGNGWLFNVDFIVTF